MKSDPGLIEDFLTALFGAKSAGLCVLIWTLKDKRSEWFTDPKEAAQYAAKMAESTDTYFGVGLAPRALGPFQRCPKDDIAAIASVWCDLDIFAPPFHDSPLLPKSMDEAADLIGSLPIRPGLVIDTGHGLQSHWIFKEPWEFRSDSERAEAQALVTTWADLIDARAAERGWKIGARATSDLSRILRLPGTFNRKDKRAPVPVVYREALNGRRVNIAELCEFAPVNLDKRKPATNGAGAGAGAAAMFAPAPAPEPDARPDPALFEALVTNNMKFRDSWEHQRADFKDQSPSVYDDSLAHIAAAANWPEAEIHKLLVAHRKRWSAQPKPPQYFERTIRRALSDAQREGKIEAISNAPYVSDTTEGKAVAINDAISKLIGERVVKWRKQLGKRGAEFVLETERGEYLFGDGENILNFKRFRSKVFNFTNAVVPPIDAKDWEVSAAAIAAAAVIQHGHEDEDRERARAWLGAYLEDNRPADYSDEHVRLRNPVVKDGSVYVYGDALRSHIKGRGELITPYQMGQVLRAAGAKDEALHYQTSDGKHTTRLYWKLPGGT